MPISLGLGIGITTRGGPSSSAAPPLAAGARTVIFGNSIAEYNFSASSGVSNHSVSAASRGEFTQLQTLDPRFSVDTWASADTYDSPYNRDFYGADQGYATQTSTTILSRIANVTAMLPDLVIYSGGINDGGNTAVSVQNAKDIIQACLAIGAKVLFIPYRPKEASVSVAQDKINRDAYIALMQPECALYPGQVWYHSLENVYDADFDGFCDAGKTSDGLHPNSTGAYGAAVSLLTTLRQIVQAGDIMALNANAELTPALSGTTGTKGHANITGNVPTGWTVEFVSGSTATVVCSITGGVVQFDVTPGASDTVIRMRQTTNVVSVIGEWFQMYADVEFLGVGNVQARLEDNVNPTNYYASGVPIDGSIGVRGKSLTPPIAARGTAMRPGIRFTATGAAAPFSVKMYSITAKKKTNPKTTWNVGSVPTVTVAPTAPTGTLTVGQVLTANQGTWAQNSGTIAQTTAYRWYSNGTFRGASLGTSSTYTTVAGDVGTTITVGVSKANAAGRSLESVSPGVVIA